jgi:hypothetical protein
MPEILPLEKKGDIHQPDKYRHFHKRPYDCREGLTRIDAENGNRDGNREFKIVARSGE